MLGNQNHSHVSSLFSKNTAHRKNNYGGSWKKNWTLFLSIDNDVKPPRERVRPPLRCIAYRKESECVCNLIVLRVKGEVSRKFDVISKPKIVCLTTETKSNCLVLL